MTQRAASIADLMYMPNGSRTGSSYSCLLRIRAILSLAMRVAAILHGYTEMMASGDSYVPQEIDGEKCNGVSIDKEEGGDMELTDQHKEGKTQDVQMAEKSSSEGTFKTSATNGACTW